MVEFTDERAAVLGRLAGEVEGLTASDAASTPYLMVGTAEEIVDHVEGCVDRWEIDTFVVRALDDFAPVLAAMG